MTSNGAELSPYQEKFWLLGQLMPDAVYGVLTAWRIRGPLRTDVLHRSLRLLVGRHEALRVRIDAVAGSPRQTVSPDTAVALPVLDYSAVAPAPRRQAVDEALRQFSVLAFDLARGPLLRFSLLKLSRDDHILVRHAHQMVIDQCSEHLLDDELSAAYNALLDGRDPAFDSQGIGYVEYVRRYHKQFDSKAQEDKLQFWLKRLRGLPILEFPADRPRPVNPERGWDSVDREISCQLADRARELADRYGTSLYQVLATAVAVVLCRHTSQDDIAIGMPISSRQDGKLRDLVGCLTALAVLRVDLTGNPSFTSLLGRVSAAGTEIQDYADVPFHLIVDRLRPVRAAGLNPLFQVCVRLRDMAHNGGLTLAGLACEPHATTAVASRLDLALDFTAQDECLRLAAEYSIDLFDRWRISALLGHVENVLHAAITDPSLRVSELPVISAAERQQLLALGQGESAEYSPDPLHVTFAKTASRQPDAVAVVCRGIELSYGELDRQATQLGRYLRSLGLQHEHVVAVVIDRCLPAYVAMVGVLKAGCAYAMMDPNLPSARLDFMIADTAATVVLTRAGLADRLPDSPRWSVVCLDSDWPVIEAAAADEPLAGNATGESLAYVIYTSGSTGTPKGVLVRHRAVASFCAGYRQSFNFGSHDRLLQLPALNFDMSQGEIWTAFLVGATIIAVAPEEAAVAESVSTLMRRQRVTYAGLSLAMQAAMDAEPYPALKYIMGGAEALVPGMVNKWNLPGRRYLNLYGPTEGTIAQTEYVVDHIDWKSSPPIGRPLANRRVYVVDSWNNLVPIGVSGELLIGGADGTLASGYLNQPELTAEKFIQDQFVAGGRVYRSGDLVRWSVAGQIEFIGRIDNQVNLGGHRVELGEIEGAVQSHPGVARAVVLMRRDRNGKDRLVCYFTATNQPPTIGQLRMHLAAWLQEYVIPTAWVPLERFPMNTTGAKIDRAALPDPIDDIPSTAAARGSSYEQIARCFSDVLSLPPVDFQESFFGLGGNSLDVVRLVKLINARLGVSLAASQVFANPTIEGLAELIDNVDLADRASPR